MADEINDAEKGFSICGKTDCGEKATIRGFIYGHFKEEESKEDGIIHLNVCEEHAKLNDFYVEGPIEEKEEPKPSFRYNVIFICSFNWDSDKDIEVGRYESNHPFPDLVQGNDVKVKGKEYRVLNKKVEYDPDESLVVIYDLFCKELPTEGDDEE
jgi:hypothetical protein